MIDFTPIYRGTAELLRAEAPKAACWFQLQVAPLLGPTDLQYVDQITSSLDAPFKPSIERERGSGYIAPRTSTTDWFYVWRIKDHTVRYGDKKFVVRRDGTVNMDVLAKAVRLRLDYLRTDALKTDVLTQNKALWETDWGDVHPSAKNVTLSNHVVGRCQIKCAAFSKPENIEINHVSAYLEWSKNIEMQIIRKGWLTWM